MPPAARRLALAAAVLLGLGALGLAALLTARAAQADLLAARGHLERALGAVTDGDVGAAAAAFADADREASAAVAALRAPQVRIVSFLPVIGGSVESAIAVATAAQLVADAGSGLFEEVAQLPGGLDALIPRDQRLPTELAGLASAFERGHRLLTLAGDIVASAPPDTLMSEVDEARAALAVQLAAATPRLEQLASLARAVPAFLGADGERRYLLGAQNPAELRGTGGLMGAFAILDVDDGRLAISDFTQTQELDRDLPPPAVSNPDYLTRYGANLSEGFFARWANLNMTPDMPTAAEAILSSYRAATGDRLDGLVLVDPYALQALMTVTGPTEIPEIGRVTAETVVEIVASEARAFFDDNGERKETLGDVAAEVLEEFLGGAHDPAAQARAIAEATGGGHVLLYSADPVVQEDIEAAGLAGALAAAEPGYLGVFGQNLSQSKLDFYLDRHVLYELFPNPDGSATGVIEITLTNLAPTTGLPAYTVGPEPVLGLDVGENLTSLSVYCGPCEPRSTTRSSDYLGVFNETELGHAVLETWEPVEASSTAQIRHVVQIPTFWSRQGDEGQLVATFQDQSTIRPTRLTVIIHPVGGWDLVPQRPDVGVRDDGAAVWDGDALPLQHFPVRLLDRDPAARIAP